MRREGERGEEVTFCFLEPEVLWSTMMERAGEPIFKRLF